MSAICELLNRIDAVRVGIIGDFCLDAYWHADMTRSELSRETPHFPLPITQERYSPGGAGNVAANLLALHPRSVTCLGVFGKDWRGHALREALEDLGADLNGIIIDPSRVTNTYIKPLRKGISDVVYEDPRLDFTNYEPLTESIEQQLIQNLEKAADELDVLCVSDQMPYGCVTPAVRQKICELGAKGLRIIVDSRDRINLYHSVIIKPNDVEACRALQLDHTTDLSTLGDMAKKLECTRTARPVIITVGPQGCLYSENGQVTTIPAFTVSGEIDICGAGDTFLSAFACSLAANLPLNDASTIACAASSVTIRKLKTTGTASREEICQVLLQPPSRKS